MSQNTAPRRPSACYAPRSARCRSSSIRRTAAPPTRPISATARPSSCCAAARTCTSTGCTPMRRASAPPSWRRTSRAPTSTRTGCSADIDEALLDAPWPGEVATGPEDQARHRPDLAHAGRGADLPAASCRWPRCRRASSAAAGPTTRRWTRPSRGLRAVRRGLAPERAFDARRCLRAAGAAGSSRWPTSCWATWTAAPPASRLMALIEGVLRDQGYSVARNDPFKGVEIIARNGRPAERRHSLQIEIKRSCYADVERHVPNAGFERMQRALDAMLAALATHVRGQACAPRAADESLGERWLLAACVALTAGCASLPPQQRIDSSAFSRHRRHAHRPGHRAAAGRPSGPVGHPCHARRLRRLCRARGHGARPQRSIDVQYFIWHDDQVGRLMFEALWQAAERGVRVRLLLDDGGTAGIDGLLAMLDAHPNIELRLYNPFCYRGSRALGYMTRLPAPEQAHAQQVLHCRQPGQRGRRAQHRQRILRRGRRHRLRRPGRAGHRRRWCRRCRRSSTATGTAPRPIRRRSSWRRRRPTRRSELQAAFAAARADPRVGGVPEGGARRPAAGEPAGPPPASWTGPLRRLLYDDPAKTLDRSARTDVLLFPALMESLGRPVKSFDIVSPYFVPGDDGTALLAELARSGVQVRVLTNSLASSDESVVHAGYMKRRATCCAPASSSTSSSPRRTNNRCRCAAASAPARSAGLHAKTYAVDGERIFVGSFNFDQRSAQAEHRDWAWCSTARWGRANWPSCSTATCAHWPTRCAWRPRREPGVGRARCPGRPRSRYDVDPQTDWGNCASRSASCPACRSTGCCSREANFALRPA